MDLHFGTYTRYPRAIEERRKVAGTAVMRHVPKKEVLYLQNEASDYIYILKEGKVKIYRQAPEWKEIILNSISPGEMFGELGIVGQQEREEVAEAMEEVVVCQIPLNKLQ